MTATTGRLTRVSAVIAGLAAAIMLLAGLQANSAKAADLVGNPGTFTVTWGTSGSDGFRWAPNHLNESKFPIGSMQSGGGAVTYQINVAPNGAITQVTNPTFNTVEIYSDCLTGAFLCIGAPKGVKSTPQVHPNGWTGAINPLTGVVNLNMPMRVRMQSASGSAIDDCYVGSNANPIAIAPSTTKSGGVAYNFTTGTARVTDAGFTSPAPGGAGGGGGSSNCDRTNSYPSVGLPTSDTHAYISLTIKNGAGEPVRPWPVRPSFTVNPDPVGVTQTATFNASASVVDDGVKACANPDPSEPNCGYRWDFDGDGTVDAVTNGATATHAYTTSGNKTPKLTVFDVNGKSDTVTGAVWVQDLPVAQIDSGPAATVGTTNHAFTFSIPTNPYGATPQCSVDNGAFSACSSGDSFSFSQTDDASGSHSLRVRGITPGGVAGPPDEYTFTIDRVKPRVSVSSGPADPTNVTSADFEFTADKPGSTLECRLDGGSWQACGTGSTGTASYSGPLGESPNPHVFEVRATDPLGNIGGGGNPGGGSYSWEVDLTKPTLNFDDVPGNPAAPGNPGDDTQPLISWINNEAIQTALCRLNRGIGVGAWTSCGTLISHQLGVPTALSDGEYTFQVRTQDVAGNWGDVTSYTWHVETINPNIEIVRAPAANANRSVAFFDFDFESGADVRCQLDSEPVQDPCTANIWAHPTDSGLERGRVGFDRLADGPHSFTVIAKDSAANETAQVYAWSIKTTVPAITLNTIAVPDPVSTSDAAAFEFAVVNGDAQCNLDDAGWEPCDSNTGQSYSDLAGGAHTFEVKAVDEAGTETGVEVYSWIVLAEAPQVEFSSTPPATTGSTSATFAFDVDTADPDAAVTCVLDGADPFPCASPTSVTALGDGPHTFTVTAVDAADQTGSATYEWDVKASLPELAFSETPAAISNSASASFAFGSNESGNDLECRLDTGAWEACASPVDLSGLGEGDHTFTVRGSDALNNTGSAAYSWRVDTVAPSVTVSATPQSSTERIADVIEFSASESGVSFSCAIDSSSAQPCTSPLLVKELSIGAHKVEIQATDAAGNTGAKATVQWTVTKRLLPEPASGGSSTQSSSGGSTPAAQYVLTRASCPKVAGGCTITLRALSGGKSVSKAKRIKLAKGKSKQVRLKVRKTARKNRVMIRQNIRTKKGKKLRVRTKGRVIGA